MAASNVERASSRPLGSWDIVAVVETCSDHDKTVWRRKNPHPNKDGRPSSYTKPFEGEGRSRGVVLSGIHVRYVIERSPLDPFFFASLSSGARCLPLGNPPAACWTVGSLFVQSPRCVSYVKV